MYIMKKIICLGIVASLTFSLAGCGEMQIFEDKDAKYRLKAVERGELQNDTYYIKDGTKFYKAHKLSMSSEGEDLDVTKCSWAIKDEGLLPSYYRNELIAKAGTEINTEMVTLERYKDCGYSIGIYGATFTDDGYISLRFSEHIIPKTSAKKELDNEHSQNIKIETINGQPVTKDMLNEAGIIQGMEKDGVYEITYYAGTYYGVATITADTHFFQSYEIYKVTDFEITKNGYVAIRLPEDLNSGYYRIDGSGFFKYYDMEKSEVSASGDINWNIPYYETEEDQMAAYSQQFVFTLEANTANMSVLAVFDPKSVVSTSGIVKMMLTAPDGKRMIVETVKEIGEISCAMTESQPGKWIVNLTPQSMKIKDVQLISNESVAEASKETFTMDFDKDMTGVVFTLDYEGEGTVTAQVLDTEGHSYDMVLNEKERYSTQRTMEYKFAYLAAGEYKIQVYHYPDTVINGVDYYLSDDVKEIEVIVVEE